MSNIVQFPHKETITECAECGSLAWEVCYKPKFELICLGCNGVAGINELPDELIESMKSILLEPKMKDV